MKKKFFFFWIGLDWFWVNCILNLKKKKLNWIEIKMIKQYRLNAIGRFWYIWMIHIFFDNLTAPHYFTYWINTKKKKCSNFIRYLYKKKNFLCILPSPFVNLPLNIFSLYLSYAFSSKREICLFIYLSSSNVLTSLDHSYFSSKLLYQ